MGDQKGLLVTLLILAIVLVVANLVGIYVAVGNNVDEQALSDKVTAQVLEQIPTAEEIADAVEIPEVVDNKQVGDLWKDLYEDEIEELEAEAYDVAELELEDRNYRLLVRWLEDYIEGFDELEDVGVEDYEVRVTELGLEDDEDKAAEVVFEVEVEYTLKEGVVQDYKKQVTATANVLFEEGDYNDEEVELVFA